MTEMQNFIPMPGLLADASGSSSDRDPATSHEHAPIADRPARDPSDVAIDEPLAVYARQLWTQLGRLATYLRDDVARGGGSSLLHTEEQWQQWQAAYAPTLSVLAGPAGDSGFGEQEAKLEHQNGFAG